jgi:hypothetical protein
LNVAADGETDVTVGPVVAKMRSEDQGDSCAVAVLPARTRQRYVVAERRPEIVTFVLDVVALTTQLKQVLPSAEVLNDDALVAW